MKTLAKNLVPGQIFTDEMYHTHTVKSVDTTADGTNAGVYVHVDGQNYPEFYGYDHVVIVDEAFEAKRLSSVGKANA